MAINASARIAELEDALRTILSLPQSEIYVPDAVIEIAQMALKGKPLPGAVADKFEGPA